ncbi:MAG: hypothetical protein AAF348_05720 [Bacteroidota bacterium]
MDAHFELTEFFGTVPKMEKMPQLDTSLFNTEGDGKLIYNG